MVPDVEGHPLRVVVVEVVHCEVEWIVRRALCNLRKGERETRMRWE
jgi:hypothetical protein